MIADLLKKVPLFANLADEELETLSKVTHVRSYLKDTMIIWAEDEGDSFFVIQSGEVKVSVTAGDGREVLLSRLGPGEFVGDMSLLDGEPRSADVTTMIPTEALVLLRTDFHQALRAYPSIGVHLLVTLATRLRKADRHIGSLALLGITDRICSVLVTLADEEGEETEEGVVIRKRPTHQMIANMAGTARETVTRVLRRLSREWYIRSNGRELIILRRSD